MDQKERRDKGLLYLTDDTLVEELNHARRLMQQLNTIDRTDSEGIARIAGELLNCKGDLLLNPPFTWIISLILFLFFHPHGSLLLFA